MGERITICVVGGAGQITGKLPKVLKKRNSLGQFARITSPWSLADFNNGFVRHFGYRNGKMRPPRFMVYLPNHPRASKLGYVFREIVAYEAYHPGIQVIWPMMVHHVDKDTLNDSEENLRLVSNSEHQIEHKRKMVECTCRHCGKRFEVIQWRINEGRGIYCSTKCSQAHPQNEETRARRSRSLKRIYRGGQ